MASVLDAVKHYQQSIEKHSNDKEKVLRCIDKLFHLDVTTQHLQDTGVGRTVNALRKDPGEVGTAARSLVYKWKRMVAAEESDHEGDQTNGNDTSMHNGNGSGKESDDNSRQHKSRQEQTERSTPKSSHTQHRHMNGHSTEVKRKYHSTEEEEPNSKKIRHSISDDDHKKHDFIKKEKLSDSESDDESDSSESDSESYTSESSQENAKHSREQDIKVKKENESPERHKSATNHHIDYENHKRESSSSKSTHESKRNSSDHSKSKDSSKNTSELLKTSSKHKSSHHRENSSEKKHKSDHKVTEDKTESKESYKHNSSEKQKSSGYKHDHTDKHKSRSDIQLDKSDNYKPSNKESDKHRSSSQSKESDKHRSLSQTKDSDKHKSSSQTKDDKHRSSSHSDKESSKHKSSSHADKSSDKHKSSSQAEKENERHKSSSRTEKDSDKHKSSESSKHRSKESSSSKEKHSSSSKEKSSDRSSSSKEKSSSHSEKKKPSSESKSPDKAKQDTSEESGKKKEKSSSSHTSKSSHKSKDEVPKKKVKISNSEDSEEGIDCGSGASFAEALGMMVSPSKPKKSKFKDISPSPNNSFSNDFSPAALLAPSAKLAPLPNIEISALPEISPNYKPRPPPKPLPHFTDEDAISAGISSKNQRTKVYSGNKIIGKITSLYDMCVGVLQEHIDALEYTGGVPYEILKPVIDKATPNQLFVLEHYNAYLMEDTDHLWQKHCEKHFRNKKRQEMETWREMYMRCQEEQESRLKSLTANIRMTQEAKKAPIKQTKMAYVDSVVKPPRNIARKQAQHGTAHAATASPAARVASLASGPNLLKSGMPRPPNAAPVSSTSFNKPKKAPLMQKALQFMRGRKR